MRIPLEHGCIITDAQTHPGSNGTGEGEMRRGGEKATAS
jgi:hypothetical protein